MSVYYNLTVTTASHGGVVCHTHTHTCTCVSLPVLMVDGEAWGSLNELGKDACCSLLGVAGKDMQHVLSPKV